MKSDFLTPPYEFGVTELRASGCSGLIFPGIFIGTVVWVGTGEKN